jgi:PAS domain S-box-containing protein
MTEEENNKEDVQVLIKSELDRSEARFKTLFENSPAAISIINENGVITACNNACEGLIGYSKEEIIGRPFDELLIIVPEDLKDIVDKFSHFPMEEIDTPYELQIIRKDGKKRWIRVFYSICSGQDDRMEIQVISEDITDRKKAEKALMESEEKFRNLSEKSPNMIFIHNMKQIVYVNEKCIDIMGYSKNEFYDTGFDFFSLIAPESRETVQSSFISHMKGEDVIPYEYTIITRSGRNIEGLLTTKLISYGGESAILGIITDITKRKEAEDQIRASLNEKEVLLKEIHHRVKNNLQIISSMLNLQAIQIMDDDLKAVFKESMGRVQSMAIVHEKMYHSKDLSKIGFAEYINDLTRELFSSYGVDPSQIISRVNIEDIKLGVDIAIPCGLIVNELISNSLKHAFPNGEKGEISIDLNRDPDDNFKLMVCDNGKGFPENVDFTEMESLGLRLVNTLVEQLKGTIEMERSEGTRFKIEFTMPDKVNR